MPCEVVPLMVDFKEMAAIAMETAKMQFILIFFIFILAAILKWRPFCPTDSDFVGLSRSTRCGCDKKHYCTN
jgi:hypothetical protein